MLDYWKLDSCQLDLQLSLLTKYKRNTFVKLSRYAWSYCLGGNGRLGATLIIGILMYYPAFRLFVCPIEAFLVATEGSTDYPLSGISSAYPADG